MSNDTRHSGQGVRPSTAQGNSEGARPADVFVPFGITGDLAKVMTFRSLYELERRGLLDCPIVGVAFDHWTDDDLRARARSSIEGAGAVVDEGVFARLAKRLSYVSGDFTERRRGATRADRPWDGVRPGGGRRATAV